MRLHRNFYLPSDYKLLKWHRNFHRNTHEVFAYEWNSLSIIQVIELAQRAWIQLWTFNF